MLVANEIKVGTVLYYAGARVLVYKFLGKRTGQNGKILRFYVVNIDNGENSAIELDSTEKFENLELYVKTAKLSYIDEKCYHFMDLETYDDIILSKNFLGTMDYLSPDDENIVEISFCEEKPIDINLK